jgi:hypothetical protein
LIGIALPTGSGCAVMQPIRLTMDPARPAYSKIQSGQSVVLHLDDVTVLINAGMFVYVFRRPATR